MAADLSLLALSVFKLFWPLVPALALVRLLMSRRGKGLVGELRVSWLIRRHLDRRTYHSFRNLLLPTADGSTQLDHVLVSPYGIFVIETKNMQGLICGSTHERHWTQQLGSHVRSFQNPLHQNYKHTKTLHELLGIRAEHVVSLIVFIGTSEFGTVMPDNVSQGSEFIRLIQAHQTRLFSMAQADALVKAINAAKLKSSFRSRRQHVRHVHALAAERQRRPQPCPCCGRAMVLREARKGRNAGRSFWGCSAFPQCEGTRNAD